MRRYFLIGLLGFASGCSNAPLAGFLDCVSPAHGNRADGRRGPVVPESRPSAPPIDNLPPAADVTPSIAPRP